MTKANPSVTENIDWDFRAIPDAVATYGITEGDYVTTKGRLTRNDGGGGKYLVVAAGTGTDGFGEYIDLTSSGVQLQLIHNGEIAGEQFGAVNGVECSAQMQAAWDVLTAWQRSQPDPNTAVIRFKHSSTATIENQIQLNQTNEDEEDPGLVRVISADIDFSRSYLTAVPGGDLSDTNAMLLCRLRGTQYWGFLDGGKFAACMDMFGMSGSRSFNGECIHGKGKMIDVRGASGTFNWYNLKVREYNISDDEFNTDSNFTATGVYIGNGDFMLFSPNLLYCKIPLAFDAVAVGVHIHSPHIVNDNPNTGGTGSARVNPILIENRATRSNFIYDAYLDNGSVDDYGGTLNLLGNTHYVHNNKSTIVEPLVRIIATSAGQLITPELVIQGLVGQGSVGFVDDGANTWAGDITQIATHYTDMKDEDRVVNLQHVVYNLYPNNPAAIEVNGKAAGNFQISWESGTDDISVIHKPGERVTDFNHKVIANSFGVGTGGTGGLFSGTGSPEGVTTAGIGSMFMRTDGGAGTSLYVKESGAGNTGWVGK